MNRAEPCLPSSTELSGVCKAKQRTNEEASLFDFLFVWFSIFLPHIFIVLDVDCRCLYYAYFFVLLGQFYC